MATDERHVEVVIPAIAAPHPNVIARATLDLERRLLDMVDIGRMCGDVVVSGYLPGEALSEMDRLSVALAKAAPSLTAEFDQCRARLADPTSGTVLLVASCLLHGAP